MRKKAVSNWTRSLLVVALVAAAGTVQAGEGGGNGAKRPDGPAMPIGGAALPPAGFLALCARSPIDCVAEGEALPDLAALEAAANRRLWSDLFQARSAPAALAGPDIPDWSAIFAKTARGRAVTLPAVVADDATVTADAGLTVASPALFELAGQKLFDEIFETAFDAFRSGFETPAETGVDPADADKADTSDVVVAVPVEAATFAEIETEALAAGDVAVPAVEVAAVDFSDMALSPTDLPTTNPVHIHAEAKTVAAPVIAADAVSDRLPEEPAAFTLDRAGWRLVNGVNRRLNREIRQASDSRLYGMEDFWNRPEGGQKQGDCEDYVLAKRAALIAEGVPAAVLSIAIVETRWGESHAVLLLASDRGEFVLDSLSPWVSRWDRVDYAWRERQIPGRPFDWVRIAV